MSHTPNEATAENTVASTSATEATDTPEPARRKKGRKSHGFVQYIGIGKHLFHANKRAVLQAFEAACESGVKQVTLTIDIPYFTRKETTMATTLRATLPVYASFAVVETNDLGYVVMHRADTWEQIQEAAQEHAPHVDRNYVLNIYGFFPSGLTDAVDLMQWVFPPFHQIDGPPMSNNLNQR